MKQREVSVLSRLAPHEHTAMTLEMLVNLFESSQQAPNDFVGEQRDWHVPRLQRAAILAMQLYGYTAYEALTRAKTPYGDPILRDEPKNETEEKP